MTVTRCVPAGVWTVAAPGGLLILGGLIGYPFSLDQRVALERLLGLVLAAVLGIVATVFLRRVTRPTPFLVGGSILALLAGLWVISASGPDVFRGTVGNVLNAIFRPVFGLAQVTDPIEITNTRFIVGYNGLADLCLVAVFGCGAVLLERPGRRLSVLCAALIAMSVVLLIGTGARGGLTGLAAGIVCVALFAWPRRYWLVAVLAAPLAVVVAAIGILDKGLEFSSTAGRLSYWSDLARLLVEYPLTGTGLGVDTAYMVTTQYEINPDPERVYYAHNTFVQSYMEQGPPGFFAMLVVPLLVVAAVVVARRSGFVCARRSLIVFGLGLAAGLEAHGLTDQVVTTNVGTWLLVLGFACVLSGLTEVGLRQLDKLTRITLMALVGVAVLTLAACVALPVGRAQALLDLGGLQMNQALNLPAQDAARAAGLARAESTLSSALSADSGQPAVLRDLAWVRAAQFDDSGGLQAVEAAAASTRIDTFDQLQIAHAYRDLGVVDQAYAWAARAYADSGRAPEDAVMQVYAQSTLSDSRARTLATQAEAAMLARHFSEAHSLFEQALTFEADSQYLQDRIGAAQRAVDKYGG